MKNLIQKFIISGLMTMVSVSFASNVFAAPLEAVFNPDPLFNKPNFLPGDETEGIVTVTNNSGAMQNILTEAINVSDNDNFGNLLRLKIEGDSGTLFDDPLSLFFSTAGEVPLGSISDGESEIFTYTISFIDSDNNSYQGKTLGFDVCVGFKGGNTHCGDTVVGGENDTGGNGGGGGGGSISGRGGGPIILTILNEQTSGTVAEGEDSATATITWDTNILSTSQVIYGLAPGPYALSLTTLPNLGYPFGTVENTVKVLRHSVLLTGLIPGETYLYRVVSRASPPTVSFEHEFTVPLTGFLPLLAQAGNNNLTGGNSSLSNTPFADISGAGSVSGPSSDANKEGFIGSVPISGDDTAIDSNIISSNSLTAGALFSGFNDLISICTWISLLILIALYAVWQLWLRKKYERSKIPEKKIWDRLYLFFAGTSALVIFVFIIFGEYCYLPVFMVTFMVSLCFYAYRKLRVE